MRRQYRWAYNLSGRLLSNPAITLEIIFNILREKIYGIETYKKVGSRELDIPMDLMPVEYSGSGNSYLGKVLKRLKITSQDSIIDLGCGKGSALLYLAKFSFSKIVGVEYSYDLFLKAKFNVEKMKQAHIQLIHGDAGDYNGFDDINYIYMYNPFGRVTMNRVMDRIRQSYKKKPRDIYIIYKNPTCHAEILNSGIFDKTAEFKSEWNCFKFYLYKTHT